MVEVTQADRAAAAEVVFNAMRGGLNWFSAEGARDRILAGKCDADHTVQAFARHRIATLEEAAQVCDVHYAEIGRCADAARNEGSQDSVDRCHARMRSASQIAASIRALKGEG